MLISVLQKRLDHPQKVKLMHNAANAACNKLDGLADGVIGVYEKCMSVFDVGTLRCPFRFVPRN